MRRYTVRPRSHDWWDDEPMLPHLTVYEPDDRPRPTGLLDHHGNELMAVDEREPIGFMRFRDR